MCVSVLCRDEGSPSLSSFTPYPRPRTCAPLGDVSVMDLQHEAGLLRHVVTALLLCGGDAGEDGHAVPYALHVAAAAGRGGAAAGPERGGEDEDEVE